MRLSCGTRTACSQRRGRMSANASHDHEIDEHTVKVKPYTDGTLHPRDHPHLVLGVRDGDNKTILVSQDDHRRRLVFRELQAMQ